MYQQADLTRLQPQVLLHHHQRIVANKMCVLPIFQAVMLASSVKTCFCCR